MADRATIANALRLAKGCARDARLLADQGSRNAAYLAEQALEQVIRAIATSEGIHISRSDAHQLDKLVRQLPDEHAEKATLSGLTWLEAYATTFRYTLPSGQIPRAPQPEKLLQAIATLDELIERAAHHFDVGLREDTREAGRTTPMRR